MLYLSNEIKGVLAQKVMIIHHPESKEERKVIDTYRSRTVAYLNRPTYVEAGVTRLADYVWRSYNSVVVLPCSEKTKVDYIKRLCIYLPMFKQLMSSTKTHLYFCGKTVNFVSDKVLFVPNKNVFYNDTTHSLNIDISSDGLGLITNSWYDTGGYDVNDARYKVLQYLSKTRPIYEVNGTLIYGNSFTGLITEFNHGSVTNMTASRYGELFMNHQTASKIKPMTPIYKEKEDVD
jgi:hypothetical protein